MGRFSNQVLRFIIMRKQSVTGSETNRVLKYYIEEFTTRGISNNSKFLIFSSVKYCETHRESRVGDTSIIPSLLFICLNASRRSGRLRGLKESIHLSSVECRWLPGSRKRRCYVIEPCLNVQPYYFQKWSVETRSNRTSHTTWTTCRLCLGALSLHFSGGGKGVVYRGITWPQPKTYR